VPGIEPPTGQSLRLNSQPSAIPLGYINPYDDTVDLNSKETLWINESFFNEKPNYFFKQTFLYRLTNLLKMASKEVVVGQFFVAWVGSSIFGLGLENFP